MLSGAAELLLALCSEIVSSDAKEIPYNAFERSGPLACKVCMQCTVISSPRKKNCYCFSKKLLRSRVHTIETLGLIASTKRKKKNSDNIKFTYC